MTPPLCTSTVDWLRTLVLDRWSEWNLPGEKPDHVHVLQVAAGNWHVGQRRVTWLVFHPEKRDPLLVSKCSLGKKSATLANEYRAVTLLRDDADSLTFSPPEALAFQDEPAATFLVQRAVPGAPLHAHPTRGTYRSDAAAVKHGFELATDLCESLLKRSNVQPRVTANESPRVQRLLDKMERLSAKGALNANVSVLGERLAKVSIPTTWHHHGDLTSNHILLDGERCSVIDWETYAEDGLPFADLVQYALTLGQFFRGVSTGQVGNWLLGGSPAADDIVVEHFGEGIERLALRVGTDSEQRGHWLALTVLEAAVSWMWSAIEGGARDTESSQLIDRAIARLTSL